VLKVSVLLGSEVVKLIYSLQEQNPQLVPVEV